jgi:hypothetical protein
LSEKGHLLIKKPGKMRWEYTSPEQKLFVSDGVKIYSYIPQDKQVVVSSVPTDDTASAPGLFLAGNAFHGVGLPDCIASGERAADAAAAEELRPGLPVLDHLLDRFGVAGLLPDPRR